MISGEVRRSFELMAVSARGDTRALAAGLAREMTGLALRTLAANALSVAVAAPERAAQFYDDLVEGWNGHPVYAKPIRQRSIPAPLPISPAFWSGFWRLMQTEAAARLPIDFTERTAFVSSLVPPDLQERVAVITRGYPGLRGAAAWPEPARFSLDTLAHCPRGSLGAAFHRVVMARGGRLEILDRDAWQLASLPPPLAYVNVRILQCHDLWRLTAGYEDTELHRLGMAAFQLGQFGHNYSALMMALVLSDLALNRPEGTELLLDMLICAYAHGRETPSLMRVEWETLWDLPVERVRELLKVRRFESGLPSDAIERITAAARTDSP